MPEPKIAINFRLPQPMYQWLYDYATAQRTSMNEEVVRLIQQAMAKDKPVAQTLGTS